MTTERHMHSLARNPVSYSLYAFVVLFAVISFGESPILVLQHVLVPYTVDISRGIGNAGVPVFRAVAMMSQCLMCFFIYMASRHQSKSRRLAFSVIGICFVILYFLIVAFAYVMPRLH